MAVTSLDSRLSVHAGRAGAAVMTAPTAAGRAVSITNWASRAKNTLRGSFSVALPSGLILHECTLHTRDGKRWIGLPARSYEQAGERRWVRLIEFTDRA